MVGVSLAGPLLYGLAAPPNLLFAISTLALAVGAGITLYGALSAARRQRKDAAIRLRAEISPAGISFYRQQGTTNTEFFAQYHIKHSWLISGALIVETNAEHPKPGRHRLGFTKLASPRGQLTDAITALNHQSGIKL